MSAVNVVCWRWTPTQRYRSTFGPETVNTLLAMVRRHYRPDVRFICVTDDTVGIDPRVEVVPDWHDFMDLPSPHGGKNPSCYRRLRMFHPEIASTFGDRFVSIDLDCVLVADVTPLWERPEDFVAYGDTNPRPGSHYNGSMMLLRAGTRTQVWNTFDPKTSPAKALKAGCWGSDQGFISYCLGPGEAKWKKDDGVYSFRNHLQQARTLPANAKLIVFHGRLDPWSPEVQEYYPWVRQHYRGAENEVAA